MFHDDPHDDEEKVLLELRIGGKAPIGMALLANTPEQRVVAA